MNVQQRVRVLAFGAVALTQAVITGQRDGDVLREDDLDGADAGVDGDVVLGCEVVELAEVHRRFADAQVVVVLELIFMGGRDVLLTDVEAGAEAGLVGLGDEGDSKESNRQGGAHGTESNCSLNPLRTALLCRFLPRARLRQVPGIGHYAEWIPGRRGLAA